MITIWQVDRPRDDAELTAYDDGVEAYLSVTTPNNGTCIALNRAELADLAHAISRWLITTDGPVKEYNPYER